MEGIWETENQVYTCVNVCNNALYFFVGLYTKYKTHLSKDKLFAKLLQSKVQYNCECCNIFSSSKINMDCYINIVYVIFLFLLYSH